MTEPPDDSEEDSATTDDADDAEEMSKEEIEAKVREHIRRRKDAYVKMGTVDTDPDN